MLTKLKRLFNRKNWHFYFDAGREGWVTWSVWDCSTQFSVNEGIYLALYVEILSLYIYMNIHCYTGD